MSRVRPVEREDLPEVAAVYEGVMRSGTHSPPPGLVSYFERTLLDHPWADPEIPSLVYEGADGRIAGFLGAHVRRIVIDDRPARLICAGQLVTEPAVRRRGAGAVLLRDLLAGPQQVSITDGGNPEVAAIWAALGGATVQGRSMAWTRVFRPAAAIRERLLRRERWRGFARATRPLWTALDRLAGRATRPSAAAELEPPAELDVATVLEHAAQMAAGSRLRLAYDEPFVTWLFEEMPAVRSRGELVRRTVRHKGRLIGWYVAYLGRGAEGQVMQVAAADRAVDAVVDELFADAWRRGAVSLGGRLEPLLFESLTRRRCMFQPGERALVHSREPGIQSLVAAGQAALTRMDGEWWMGHHLEPFGG